MSIPLDHHLVAGDRVTISAVLEYACPPGERLYVQVGGRYGMRVSVERGDATLVQTHLAAGDRVRPIASPETPAVERAAGTIVAIAGDRAWVDWDEGPAAIFDLGTLRRICTLTVAGA